MVMHNSFHIAEVTGNFTFVKYTPRKRQIKMCEISKLQNRQIKMQLKYSALQHFATIANY